MEIIKELIIGLFYIIVFPGLLFLVIYGGLSEWLDRKFYAQMQNRQGPPWYQPFADIIKLMSKQVIIPKAADKKMFKILPFIAIAAINTSIFMIPIFSNSALYGFRGDIIAVIYLLSIPTATLFLIGWSSTSPYATIGSMRVLTQLFAYEVPLLIAVLGPCILAGSWSIEDVAVFFTNNPWLMLVNIIGFLVAIVALQGKLERVPFDIPHAETEIVCGVFTEYSGRLYGFMRLALDMEMVVVAALINAVFLGGSFGYSGWIGLLLFVIKTEFVVFLLSVLKAAMARVKINQMVDFCWKWLAPFAILQILICIVARFMING